MCSRRLVGDACVIVGNMLFGDLFEDRGGGEGRDIEVMGGYDDGFGGDAGGFDGRDGGSF